MRSAGSPTGPAPSVAARPAGTATLRPGSGGSPPSPCTARPPGPCRRARRRSQPSPGEVVERRPDPRRAGPRHHLAQHAEPQGGDVRGEDLRFPPARADRCVVFPPGAAQASRIRSPGPGRRSGAISCAPSSMTRYAPSRNAASEKTGAGFPRMNPSGANRQGTGFLPSSANRLASASAATRNGLARTAKGGFSRHAARYARVSASPRDVANASISSRGADPSAGSRRGSPSGEGREPSPPGRSRENRVDEASRAAAPRRLDRRHRFVQRRAVGMRV